MFKKKVVPDLPPVGGGTIRDRREFLKLSARLSAAVIAGGAVVSRLDPSSANAGDLVASDEICFQSATSLAKAIRTKRLSSEEVVRAFIARIEKVNPIINAVCQLASESALRAAAEADKALAGGKSLGPLHGVPFTVKDSFDTAGIITTAGTTGWEGRFPTEDAIVVRRLKQAGAIVLGKTNTPELTLSHETDNLIYGRTNNPYDLSRTCGGSSGGAAAVLAAGGSPLDLGSDTAGSIRIPSHYCGIAGLKPSAARVPRTGHVIGAGGPIGTFTQIGPMSRHVEDLMLTFPIIAGPDGSDPDIVPPYFPDPNTVNIANLRIAHFARIDGGQRVDLEIEHAVKRAAKALEEQAAKSEESQPPAIVAAAEVASALTLGDGGQYFQNLLRECGTRRIHPWTRSILNVARTQLSTAKKYSALLMEWGEIKRSMMAFMDDFDIVICPVASSCAPTHDRSNGIDFSFSTAFNLVGWPAAVVRVGTSIEGLPVGVQILGAPWMEHKVLAVAKFLEDRSGWKPDFVPDLT